MVWLYGSNCEIAELDAWGMEYHASCWKFIAVRYLLAAQ